MKFKNLTRKTGLKGTLVKAFFISVMWVALAGPVMVVHASELKGLKSIQGFGACSGTARAALMACRNEIRDDYWIAVGNCSNLSDPAERAECLKNAGKEFMEARDLCKEQLAARMEICEELGEAPYDPQINPADFVDFEAVLSGEETLVPNPYFPLVSGTNRIYIVKDREGNKIEKIKVEVLEETKEILGVNCIVVRDRVWEIDEEGEKELIEDTDDWYAQDLQGNVWYFGEIAKNYEDGELVDVEGSWKAGRDFEKAGYLMLAEPTEGRMYRQEFSLGNAEDMAQVEEIVDSIKVRGKIYYNVLKTRDFTPIEPDVTEFKYYAPGIGMILEENPEDGERVELKKIIFP